jgi:hypothetical protein
MTETDAGLPEADEPLPEEEPDPDVGAVLDDAPVTGNVSAVDDGDVEPTVGRNAPLFPRAASPSEPEPDEPPPVRPPDPPPTVDPAALPDVPAPADGVDAKGCEPRAELSDDGEAPRLSVAMVTTMATDPAMTRAGMAIR